MSRLVFGAAIFVTYLVDFTEHACSGIVRPTVFRYCQKLPPKLRRSDGMYIERAAEVFGWNVLGDRSLNGSR